MVETFSDKWHMLMEELEQAITPHNKGGKDSFQLRLHERTVMILNA